jgi:hypothetical protein
MRLLPCLLFCLSFVSAATLYNVPMPPTITSAARFANFPYSIQIPFAGFSLLQDSLLLSATIQLQANIPTGITNTMQTSPPDAFVMDLFADNGGILHAPGLFITSLFGPWPLTPLSEFQTQFHVSATAYASSPILLEANRIYWLRPSSTVAGVYGGWIINPNVSGLRALHPPLASPIPACSGTNTCDSFVLTLDGTPVPEPATWLSALALFILIKLQRYNHAVAVARRNPNTQ